MNAESTVTLDGMSIRELLDAVGAKTPTPGGGAVASITAALGAALAGMVVAYSTGRKKLAEHAALHAEASETLADVGRRALDLARADAEAYARLNALWKLDEADERRRREFPAAVRDAIDAPARVLRLARDLLDLLGRLDGRTNAMLESDRAIAAILADAAARAAAWNVRINLPLVDDAAEAERIERETADHLAATRAACEAVESACRPG
jgi:formiminotetrahydrofolate cyclodeaminase